MRSIRIRITALTLAAILISILTFGVIGVYFIIRESTQMSSQTLSLICENRKDALDDYLTSIDQSVSMISRYAIDSLDGVALTEGGVLGATGGGLKEIPGREYAQRQAMDAYFDAHLAVIESAFRSIANHTNGISACYYRINPEITADSKGFFYVKKAASDFQKLPLDDLNAYDPEDVDHVGWYQIPIRRGRPSWIGPYDNPHLGEKALSYIVPIYKAGTFIGVIGMDLTFDTLVAQIRQFTNFETGFFALADEDGRIYYHPEYEMGTDIGDVLPQVLASARDLKRNSSSEQMIRYDKGGVKWQLTYSTLVNDMKLVAVVEESEINTATNNLTELFLVTGALILLVFAVVTTLVMRRVTVPLVRLTTAAKRLADGDYDVVLDYKGRDEVGVLVNTFRAMRDRLKANISDLSSKAFTDDLTGVKSKHAYVEAEDKLDRDIKAGATSEFAVVLFDLNDLKAINDSQGHEAGDEHIRAACRIICTWFKHSPVYRIGGDEFVAILRGQDYQNLDELLAAFERQIDENLSRGRISIASGHARFDPESDLSIHAVFKRADERMYLRKNHMKENGAGGARR